MTMDIETLEPGDRVAVKAAEYAFGPSFLAGPGTVLQNRDVMSREREEIVIRFDRGVTGIFKAAVLKELLLDAIPGATDRPMADQQTEAADSSWRQNREKGWQHDIGYLLQDALRSHRYELWENGTEKSGTGWHPCSCGAWEGYWVDFEPHVADELRKILLDQQLIEAH